MTDLKTRDADEYWSLNGGDFFRYDFPNEAWIENLHKKSPRFSFVSFTQYRWLEIIFKVIPHKIFAAIRKKFSRRGE